MSYTRSTRHERCITSRSKHKPIFSKNFFSSTIIEWNNLDPGLRKSVNLSVSKTYIFSASYGHLQTSFLIATTLKEFVRIKFKRAQIQIEYKIQQINLWSCEKWCILDWSIILHWSVRKNYWRLPWKTNK